MQILFRAFRPQLSRVVRDRLWLRVQWFDTGSLKGAKLVSPNGNYSRIFLSNLESSEFSRNVVRFV